MMSMVVLMVIYMTNTAKIIAAPIDPNAMLDRDAAPVNATADVDEGEYVAVPLETPTEENVVAAGTAVVTPAACAAAVVPATSAALAVVAPETVVKMTCGTVSWVLRTVVLDEPGITEPDKVPVDSVQGTTMVVKTCTVVTGMDAATVPAEVAVSVMVEAPVTMAGLEETCAAQMPWK
jgi:hypothetical protein